MFDKVMPELADRLQLFGE